MDDFQAVEPSDFDLVPVAQNPLWQCLQCTRQVKADANKGICEECKGKMARVDDILAGRI